MAFQGVAPLFSVSGNPGFTIGDLAGAAGVGLACGIGARVFVKVMWLAKEVRTRLPRRWAWLVGGAGLAVITASSFSIFGQSLVLGPGYRTLTWVSTPDRATGLIALLMGMRLLASALTVSGGGAGGLFIPLVIEGALLGRLLSGFAHASSTLFPLVGAAAFLGAGYQTPIAAVVFVAEATGRPGFVVPGLIATVVAQLVMGGNSVTGAKEPSRGGHVEERLRLRVSAAMVRDGVVVDPATTIDRLLHDDFLRARARSLPVVEADGAYLGMVRLSDVADVPIEERDDRTVSEMLRREVPAAETGWTLREAVVAMQASGVDRLAVTDGERYIGAVSMSDILRLDEIIEATEGAAEPD